MTEMTRVWAMPSAETFSIRPIARLLDRYLQPGAVILDPFARNSLRATHTNDLNPATEALWHLPAEEFIGLMTNLLGPQSVDVLLFDPPYSPRQISEAYQSVGRTVSMETTQNARLYAKVRELAHPLIRMGGHVISCGWNSTGMGKGRGYELLEVLLVAHGGGHNDTIVTVERKVAEQAILREA